MYFFIKQRLFENYEQYSKVFSIPHTCFEFINKRIRVTTGNKQIILTIVGNYLYFFPNNVFTFS